MTDHGAQLWRARPWSADGPWREALADGAAQGDEGGSADCLLVHGAQRRTARGVSGKSDRRPALNRLRRDAMHGKLDVVAAWSVDRLGRSVAHVVSLLHDLTEQKVAVYLHQQRVDGTTSAGKAMLAMCAVFSEFEWNNTSDRVRAGQARARKEGKRIGRPTTVTAKTEARIRDLRKSTTPPMGIIKIAKTVGCGVSTVQRVLAAVY